MRWEIFHFNIKHGGEPTQALRTNSQGIHFIEQFQTQLFRAIASSAQFQIVDVDRLHQCFFG